MKFLFLGFILLMPLYNLYADGLSPKCLEEMNKLCPEEKSKCLSEKADKISAECKVAKAPANPCADMAMENKCKDKKDAELIKCLSAKGMSDEILKNMKKGGSQECQKFLGNVKKEPDCPLPPNPIYKNRADEANAAYDKYFDSLSPECKAKANLH